jgi:shikimate kinase
LDADVLVVISGPIASGKSTLGRAVAARLRCAVLDLDLVYESLDPERRPKHDQEIWRDARRTAGLFARALLAEGRDVVIEGDFRTAEKRADLDSLSARYVTLVVQFDEALRRAQADPTRGLSRDRDILGAHYREDEPGLPTDLVLDTEEMPLAECVDRVLAYTSR